MINKVQFNLPLTLQYSGSFDPEDLFFEHSEEPLRNTDDVLDSDSEDGRPNAWHHPVHYVYDAAAERTQERLRQAHAAATLVDGVH